MQILVKTLYGKTIPVDVNPSDTVDAVKRTIALMEKLPAGCVQRLFHVRDELDDPRSFADYNIPESAVVHLLIRLTSRCQDSLDSPPVSR